MKKSLTKNEFKNFIRKTMQPLKDHWSRLISYWRRLPGYKSHVVVGILFGLLVFYFLIRFLYHHPLFAHLFAPYFTTVIAAIGGLITLRNFNLTHKQRQDHFDQGVLETRFTDILNRMTSKDRVIRASAANRLADIACKITPAAAGNALTETNYPYFPLSASHLASALYLEEDDSVRSEAVQALKRMTDFAKKGGEEQPDLTVILFKSIAHGNIQAKELFYEAMVEYVTPSLGDKEIPDDMIELISKAAPFSNSEEITKKCIEYISKHWEYKRILKSHLDFKQTPVEKREEVDRQLLSEVKKFASRLIDTRDALAYILPSYARLPQDIYLNNTSVMSCDNSNIFISGANMEGVDMKSARLDWGEMFGVYLRNAEMQNVNLSYANLDYANLLNAKLCDSNLKEVSLHCSNISGADLTRTKLNFAHLYKSDLRGVNLYEADLRGADLSDAFLISANLIYADLRHSHLNGTNLRGANMSGVILSDAILYNAGFSDANFDHTQWWLSDFIDPDTGKKDQENWDWLLENYPNSDLPGSPAHPKPNDKETNETPPEEDNLGKGENP